MIKIKKKLKELLEDPVYVKLKRHLSINVNPDQIEHYAVPYEEIIEAYSKSKSFYMKLKHYIKLKRVPFVIPKSKNIPVELFENDEIKFQLMKDLWVKKFEYKKTARYSELLERMKGDKPVTLKKKYDFKTEEDLKEYFKDYEALLKSMSENGYNLNIKQDELMVWIGPDGEMIKSIAGRHRMAAAKIVGAPFVPVRIRHIHQNWAEKVLGRKITSPELLTTDDLLVVISKSKEMYAVEPDLNSKV